MAFRCGIPLILGGHSFIEQLGSDQHASYSEQVDIVNTCLDNDINCFDTTYQPERITLGKILKETGRREQANIIVWNFFTDFKPGEDVGGPSYYKTGHMDTLLEQLQSNYVDALVVHTLDNEDENAKQQELVESWLSKGYVKCLGIWAPKAKDYEKYAVKNKYSFMVHPFNITTKEAAPVFHMSRKLRWQIFACSPFVRGWELEKMVETATGKSYESKEVLKAKISDLMLRYSLFEPSADRLIVAMRKSDWVLKNIKSFRRGPLSCEEKQWLEELTL